MKRTLIALALGAAALGMAGCADDYYAGGPRAYAYDHHPIGYDGYYDGFYGDVYDGYWGDEGFYYSTGPNVGFVVDRGNHFRHDAGAGFHEFHGGRHRPH